MSRTQDDRKWVVVVDDPVHALSTYLYDRDSGQVTKLFDQRPELTAAPLQAMHAREIKARDGKTLVSYLTLPRGSDPQRTGKPAQPVPLVLNVHGGPWARDAYGFNPEHQWLANRGYAVLSVNFRGSTGFGKAFVNRRRPRVGPEDARRSARRRGLGRSRENRDPGQGCDLRRVVVAVTPFSPRSR